MGRGSRGSWEAGQHRRGASGSASSTGPRTGLTRSTARSGRSSRSWPWTRTRWDTKELHAFAVRLLDQGAVYVCAWGSGCERFHDLVDEEAAAREAEGEATGTGVVMTTWHDDETLAEAVEFALVSAVPDELLSAPAPDVLAVAFGHSAWAREFEALLAGS